MVVGFIVSYSVYRQRVRRQDATGATTYPNLSALGVMVVFGIVGWFAHPVMGFLGPVFGAIADLLDSIPEQALQLALSALFILLAAWWIGRFWRR